MDERNFQEKKYYSISEVAELSDIKSHTLRFWEKEFNELKPRIYDIVRKQKELLTQVLSKAKKLISEGNKEEGGFHLLQVYRGLPKSTALIKFLSQEGIKQLLQKTENFYMQDNNREMPKVDVDLFFVIDEKNSEENKINELISKFELENLRNIKAKFLSGGQKKKLVIALSLLSEPKVLLLDECFAALDILTIKMLQEIIVNLQHENKITICICDHQARDLLACVDVAMILSNCKIVAEDTPSNLVKNINAKNAYFGDSFKFN